MAVVAGFGVHRIVFPRLARWATLAVLVLTVVVAAQGRGEVATFVGLAWIAVMSAGMAIFGVRTAGRQDETDAVPSREDSTERLSA